ncbi:MAG: phosphotransferase family protein, partial [Candidatus Hodarchaeota archaeon]
ISTMPTGDLGFMTRSQIVEKYAQKSGISAENINFYHALGLFRLTVIIAQIYIRFVRKQTQDRRFEPLGMIIPFVAQAAKDIAYDRFSK